MEKISGILPASSRITSVDLKNSGVARAGTPNFGRPQALSTVAERAQQTAALASTRHHELMDLREQNANPQLAIVDKLADDFFMKSGRPDEGQPPPEDLDLPEVGGYLDVVA